MMMIFIGNFSFLDQPSGDVVCLHLAIIHSCIRQLSGVYLYLVRECCQPLTGYRTEDLLGVPTRIQTPIL